MKIETIIYRNCEINVHTDEDAQSPNEWENEDLFLVYDHHQFFVERKGFDPESIFEHIKETKRLFYAGYYVFPLYAYIHSGVSLSLGRESYPFTCGFDTSMTGFVLVQRTKGWTYRREQAKKAAKSLVNEWNTYLSGEVYGYDSEHGSCWGFYGEDGYKEMIEEAKSEIDYSLKETLKKRVEKIKTYISNRVPLNKRELPILV